jgi:uncharacterized protein
MLNYAVDPTLLRSLIPAETELDFFQERTFLSVVGFQFRNTRVRGVAIPFHRHFEEVNLRFYVRRRGPEGWRRGVVFIRELVPRLAIALVARTVYNEPYAAVPMNHRWSASPAPGQLHTAAYGWKWQRKWNEMTVGVRGDPQLMVPGSEAEFIAEHYWGYTAQRDDSTLEYQVEHPPWRVWPAEEAKLTGDMTGCHGEKLGRYLEGPPASAFLAEGSEVAVYGGVRI